MTKILYRLLKVCYIVVLLLGVYFMYARWINMPAESHNTYSYQVICNNGKSFDPLSKPIPVDSHKRFFLKYGDEKNVFNFDKTDLNAECIYGDAGLNWKTSNLPEEYKLKTTTNTHVSRTLNDQIIDLMEFFILYYFIVEIIRRTFYYVVFGRNFVTLKKNK